MAEEAGGQVEAGAAVGAAVGAAGAVPSWEEVEAGAWVGAAFSWEEGDAGA